MNPHAVVPFGEGFLLGLGLIVGFGPQNAFILQQGSRRRFVLLIASLASLIDGALIAAGTAGAGALVASAPRAERAVALAGATFLIAYGLRSFVAATALPAARRSPARDGRGSLRAVLLTLFAVSLLNPGTYLDTLIVIGGRASAYGEALRHAFAAGATSASVAWFFALAFGAAGFGRLLRRPVAPRLVDALSGVVMWLVAGRLLLA